MTGNFVTPTNHWYRNWWGKLLIVVGILIALPVVYVGVTTVSYFLQIKRGEPVQITQLEGGWNNKISPSGKVVITVPVDRAQLESKGQFYGGSQTAPVTIVEFVDFKCPNCSAAWPVVSQLKSKYNQNIKIIMRNVPLSVHPGADELAAVAVCAAKQGRYGVMHDALFSHFNTLSVPLTETDLQELAATAGIDAGQLKQCMTDPQTTASVQDDYIAGASFGVAGTPTFFVNGVRVEGVVPLEAWQKYLSSMGY
jgi:protein-disulfide isomerase